MSSPKSDKIVLIIHDKNGLYVDEYTIHLRIAKEKAKYFDNSFNQMNYEYKSETLDKKTLKAVFDSLFYNQRKIKLEDLDVFIKVYQMLDYFMVPNIDEIMLVDKELFAPVNDFDSFVHFAKTIPKVFAKWENIMYPKFNYWDVIICMDDASYLSPDNIKRICNRYIDNIENPFYEKYLSEKNKQIIHSHYHENGECNYILKKIDDKNIDKLADILKHCNHNNRKDNDILMRGSESNVGNKLKELFEGKSEFDKIAIVFNSYLIHIDKDSRGKYLNRFYKYFMKREREYIKLCDRFLIDEPSTDTTQRYHINIR